MEHYKDQQEKQTVERVCNILNEWFNRGSWINKNSSRTAKVFVPRHEHVSDKKYLIHCYIGSVESNIKGKYTEVELAMYLMEKIAPYFIEKGIHSIKFGSDGVLSYKQGRWGYFD